MCASCQAFKFLEFYSWEEANLAQTYTHCRSHPASHFLNISRTRDLTPLTKHLFPIFVFERTFRWGVGGTKSACYFCHQFCLLSCNHIIALLPPVHDSPDRWPKSFFFFSLPPGKSFLEFLLQIFAAPHHSHCFA